MFVKEDLTRPNSEAKSTLLTTHSGKSRSTVVTQQQLVELYKKFSPACGGKREDYFGVAYLANSFNIAPEKVISHVAFGGTEFGVDAYYYDRSQMTFHIFAFRWAEDHLSLKDPLEKLGTRGIEKIFLDVTKQPDEPPMMTFLKTELFENWKSILKVVISFVFNGDPVNAEQSRVLSFLRETVEDKRGVVEDYFNRIDQPDSQHALLFQYVSNKRSLGHSSSSRQSIEYTLELGESLKVSKGMVNQMVVALVPLDSLHQMYVDLGERFFEKNIRSGLDDGSMTNEHIKRSLKRIIAGEEPSENFTLYHNGITLTAQQLESDGPIIRLVEPRILNGAQTVKILKQFIDENSTNGPNLSAVKSIANIRVLARIIKSDDNQFLKKVTINNNRQNPIMPWNLRANDLVQVGFEELFAKLGIYYERRENAYKNIADEDLELAGVEKGVIEIRKFAQSLLAMQGQVDRISEIKELFENEAWYSDTFKERYLDIDPRKFVLLYKVQFRLPSVIREIRNIGSEKYGYVSKARNLIWCLSMQGLMNDVKFAKFVEQYGNSTGIEAAITDILKTMAKLRLRFILGDTLDAKKYQTSIRDGKVSVLKTKALFNDCMTAAKARFGWEKMYL